MPFSPYGPRRHYFSRLLYIDGEEALRKELVELLHKHNGRVGPLAEEAECSQEFCYHMLRKLGLVDLPRQIRQRVLSRYRAIDVTLPKMGRRGSHAAKNAQGNS